MVEYLIRTNLKERTGYHNSLLSNECFRRRKRPKAIGNEVNSTKRKRSEGHSGEDPRRRDNTDCCGGLSFGQIYSPPGRNAGLTAAKALAMIVSASARAPGRQGVKATTTATGRPVQMHGSGGKENIRLARSRSVILTLICSGCFFSAEDPQPPATLVEDPWLPSCSLMLCPLQPDAVISKDPK